MQEPPIMVSIKDSMYISDTLNITYSILKKLKHYDGEIQDEKIKAFNTEVFNSLANEFKTLLGVITSGQ